MIPYIKNLGEKIPYTLGFGWGMKDIQINMTPEGDYIDINRTMYFLNQTLDNTYTNLLEPEFYLMENITAGTRSLYLRWNQSLTYKLQVKSRDGQYNAPVTLFVRIGTLNASQEKHTRMYWYDADQVIYYFDSYDDAPFGEAWTTNPSYMVDGNPSNPASTTSDGDVELCDGNTCPGVVIISQISQVEIRATGNCSGTKHNIFLRPVFGGTTDGMDYIYETNGNDSIGTMWSPWFDITYDPFAPSSWDWTDIDNLDCDVEAGYNPGRFTLYCSKVEIRVTYTTPPEEIVMNYNFSFSEPEITELIVNGTVYHRVNMDSLPIDGGVGVPLLPVKPVNILLPQAYVLDSITVTWEGNISLGEEFNIELGTEPAIPGQNHTSNESINFDPTIPYPIELFLNVGTYDFRGYNILTYILYPIHYIGETGELYYYENLDVNVTVIDTGEVSPFFRGLPEDEMVMQQSVDDYSMYYTYMSFSNNIGCPPIGDEYDSFEYVIITSEELKNAQGDYTFQTLQDYKNTHGTTTTIVTVEDIYDNYNGVDNQEKIRKFIKDAYIWWHTDYVLLGGDSDIIPVRNLFDPTYSLDYIPSDLYYACLNGNFNFNGNDVYGELGDLVDFRAEVYIGRACVGTDEEVSNFVYKTITYLETDSAESYIEDVLMAGEKMDKIPTWGGNYMDEMIDGSSANGYTTVGIPSDIYNIETLYDRDWSGNNWPKSEVISRINNGIHLINHLGHAYYHKNMKMEDEDVDALTNDNLCFIYSQGCMAGGFDQGDCIAEHFTVKTMHGAFAGIWNTRYGWYIPGGTNGGSQHFDRQFWDAVFGEGYGCPTLRELGAANQDSKEDNLWRMCIPFGWRWTRFCYYEITLFGDPQIAIKIPEFEPEWVSPTGHNDPDNAWDYEILAYDNDIGTKAGCTITDSYWNEWVWTPWLELTLSTPITCDKIRFYAWYSLLHCDEIDYYVYGDNTYHRTGYFGNHEWVVDDIPGDPFTNVYMAKVRFHVRRGLWSQVTADLHEFQFHQI